MKKQNNETNNSQQQPPSKNNWSLTGGYNSWYNLLQFNIELTRKAKTPVVY